MDRPIQLATLFDATSVEDAKQEPKEWKSRRHFVFAAVSSAVGLANVWRFPSLLKFHGGGAFLIVYCLLNLIHGIPLLYLEFSVGQIVKKNLLHVWGHVNLLATGIGYSCCIVSIIVASYYAVILCWLLHYFLYTFQSPLPWIFCPINDDQFGVVGEALNATQAIEQVECSKTSAEAYYWYRISLKISEGIDSEFEWNIYFIVLISVIWFLIFLLLRNGIHNASNAIYVAVIFPYISLVTLFLRTIFINGSYNGLVYLFQPEWSQFGTIKLWTDAASQAFFSLSLGLGTMSVFGGMKPHNDKRNNLKDAICVTFVDTATSLFSALVVYSILGIRAEERMNECMSNQFAKRLNSNGTSNSCNESQIKCSRDAFLAEAEGGPGLVFIDFTYTVSFLPGAPFFAAVFFFSLFLVGLTSLVSIIVSANEILCEVFCGSKWKQMFFLGVGCTGIFVLGIFFTQPSGLYFIGLYGSGQNIGFLSIVLCEILAVASSKSMRHELRVELRHRWLANAMEIICYLVNPMLITWMIISTLISSAESGGIYYAWRSDLGKMVSAEYPIWAHVSALILASIPILPLIIGFIYGLRKKMAKSKNNQHRDINTDSVIVNQMQVVERNRKKSVFFDRF